MYGNLGMQPRMQGGLMGAPRAANNAIMMQQGQPAPLFPMGDSAHLSGAVPQA